MVLVDYVSSSEEDEGVQGPIEAEAEAEGSRKRKREPPDVTSSGLPPLPSKFHDLYASSARISTCDDSNLHGGRKRVVPHIEGNWPTHLYVEWYPAITEQESLSYLINKIKSRTGSVSESKIEVNSLLTSDLGSPLPLHISLSRPIGLAADQKGIFVASLKASITRCGVRPFNVSVGNLDWVSNSEKTRWFLVLRLDRPEEDGLNRLLLTCNRTVQVHSQPPLYASDDPPSFSHPKSRGYSTATTRNYDISAVKNEKPQDFSSAFHISIAWSLEQPGPTALKFLKTMEEDEIYVKIRGTTVKVDAIKAKVGNIITSIPLQLKAVEAKGLFRF